MQVTQAFGTEKDFWSGGNWYLVHGPRGYEAKLPVSENTEVNKQDPKLSVW